jgi:hypothetical protein
MFHQEWSEYWFQRVISLPNPFIINIAKNQNITKEIIEDTITECNWYLYMTRPNFALELDFLVKFYGKDNQWYYLAFHPSLTWNYVKKQDPKLIDWEQLSRSKCINIDILKSNLHFRWDWMNLSKNLNISLQDIVNNAHLPWNWYCVSLRKDLRNAFVKMNPQIKWVESALSINAYVHYDNPDTDIETQIYVINCYSGDPEIPLDYIEKYIHLIWRWSSLSLNNNLTTEFIEKYIDKRWDWECLSYHTAVTWELISKYPGKPWNYGMLSLNPNITMDIIESNPDKPWYWNNVSYNPNLTFEFIDKHSDKPWNIGGICSNPFTLERDKFIRNKLQQHFSKSDLKEELMRRLHRPNPENPDKWVQRQIDLGFLDE